MSAYGCDGVLIATPTGSTAYTFSAGGPVLWPGVDALLVAPSNAHALFARSLVVAPESTVTVHIDPAGPNAVLACDGRRIHEIPPGSRIHVRKGEKPVTLVRLNDQASPTGWCGNSSYRCTAGGISGTSAGVSDVGSRAGSLCRRRRRKPTVGDGCQR